MKLRLYAAVIISFYIFMNDYSFRIMKRVSLFECQALIDINIILIHGIVYTIFRMGKQMDKRKYRYEYLSSEVDAQVYTYIVIAFNLVYAVSLKKYLKSYGII